ncbi:CoA transferase [Anderseniella sp. Alg231-50]|uniref:CoA transferase n=1 Tax=Anderseniella sp. Alg231-50 TaxID=1922226 RepID=UPI000D554331
MNEISDALDLDDDIEVVGEDHLPSSFAVTDLATSSLGAVGSSISALMCQSGITGHRPRVTVDRRLSSLWFARSIYPVDWEMPPAWNAIAGDYEGRDGWIKLHTNLLHHRSAAVEVLDCAVNKQAVTEAVATWSVDELETAIVDNGGAAAAMRPRSAWTSHLQGKAVASEPLIAWTDMHKGTIRSRPASPGRPLEGLRVLDLTRVLAGPVATRTLAGFGADVLRIDPVDWDEPNVVPDITLGKRCCRLNLRDGDDRAIFEGLLSDADLFIHGFRSDALEVLGYGDAARRRIAPSMIDVRLDAYGWTGPWSRRRGFDSLVQMSCGIAHAGMTHAGNDKPTPLPVQALDHATGYLMAAAAIRAIAIAESSNLVGSAKLSLARTAELLFAYRQDDPASQDLHPVSSDYSDAIEHTPWGKAHRLKAPLDVEGVPMAWSRPACELGSARPTWN